MIKKKKNSLSRLKRRVTLQQEVQIPDGAGGFSRSWQDVVELWAEIETISARFMYGQEKFVADKIQTETVYRFVIRRYLGISTAMRLAFENRIFYIKAVFDISESREFIEILAEEGSGG